MEIGIWPRLAGVSGSRSRSPSATVIGGDGVRGARFPTGVGNVVASYRLGAGASVPEPNTLRLARSVPGIRSIRSPLPFTPGKPVGDAASMRTEARRRALMLERPVSAADYRSLAASEGGVVRVEAELGWLPDSMTVGVHLTVIGTLDPHTLQSSLAAAGEPGTPIEVTLARAAPARRGGHSRPFVDPDRYASGNPPRRSLPRRSWPRLPSVETVRGTRLPARRMQRTASLARMAFRPTNAADAGLRLNGGRGQRGSATLRRQGGA